MFKIVETDNFGGDYPDEHVLSFVDSEGNASDMLFVRAVEAESICAKLNEYKSGTHRPRYYQVRDKDYVLQPGFTP